MARRSLPVALLVLALGAPIGAFAASSEPKITTAAGSGAAGEPAGDGGVATAATLAGPVAVAATGDGGFLVADRTGQTIRRIAADGRIATVAGDGTTGSDGDGRPATAAKLNTPYGVTPTRDGGFLIADQANNRIREVAPDGIITTVAGSGKAGAGGDGGPAVAADLSGPYAVAARPDGGFVIADTLNRRIRRVSADGTISTVAGTGAAGSSGDGGPATAATLRTPTGVTVASDGSILVADYGSNVVRRIAPDGVIRTVAGDGSAGSSGDGGPATEAQLRGPFGVDVLPGGGFLIADRLNSEVRRVTADGTIEVAAGTGVAGTGGDGGPPTEAQLNNPTGVTAMPDGGFLIADFGNGVVRRVVMPASNQEPAGAGSQQLSGAPSLGAPAGSAKRRLTTIRCVTRGTKKSRHSVCTVAFASAATARMKIRLRLLHGRTLVASNAGWLRRGQGRFRLVARRVVQPGSYTLVATFTNTHKKSSTQRVRVTVRRR